MSILNLKIQVVTPLLFGLFIGPPLMAEVAHDPSGCPDLTGRFEIPDPIFPPMKINITSAIDIKGVPTLSIINEESKDEDFVELDGQFKGDAAGGVTGLCNGQTIYIFEYDQGKQSSLGRLSLNSDRNLLMEVESAGESPISSIGYRQ